jgi:hypothetical protein
MTSKATAAMGTTTATAIFPPLEKPDLAAGVLVCEANAAELEVVDEAPAVV